MWLFQTFHYPNVVTVRLIFAKQSPEVSDGEPSPIKDHKRNWNKEVYYSQVLEKVHGATQGATQARSRQGTNREHGRTWAHAFIRVHGGVLWGLLDWSFQTKKSEVLVSDSELIPKGHVKESPGVGEGRETVYHKAIGEVISKTCIYLWLCEDHLGHALAWWVREWLVQFRPPAGYFAKQNGCWGSNIME